MEEDKLDADEGREEEVECGGLEWSYISWAVLLLSFVDMKTRLG